MNSLQSRQLVPELMDDPLLEPAEHRRALKGLRRINRWSGTVRQIARQILRIAKRSPQAEWRILDVGCGGGDVTLSLAKSLGRQLHCSLTGWDVSTEAIQVARESAKRQALSSSTAGKAIFEVKNILDLASFNEQANPSATFDLVYCSLFLHHFDNPQAQDVLCVLRRLARTAVLVDDLRRTTFGICLAQLGTRLLSRSRVVHFDGPQSVRAAFSIAEIQQLARAAGLWPCRVIRHWPERFLLCWENLA